MPVPLAIRLQGYTFTVEEGDEDETGFYSIWANFGGVGAEMASGIGEREAAEVMAAALAAHCA